MKSLLAIFLAACKETPSGYFAPIVALWRIFNVTAEDLMAKGRSERR